MATLPPPSEFHSGCDIEDVFITGWGDDEDYKRLKPGSVFPFRVANNPHHGFFCQAMLVGVTPDGTAHLLMDRKSVSEQLYQGGKS